MIEPEAPIVDPALFEQPLTSFSHIVWRTMDGETVDELVPWDVQAAPGMVSFRAGRTWIVESVGDVMRDLFRARFVVCREVPEGHPGT